MRTLDFQAVIFDLDGLVLDSEAGYFLAWQQAGEALGQSLSGAFCAGLSGASGPAIREALLNQCGDDFDLERFAHLSNDYWRRHIQRYGIAVKPGFAGLLQVLESLDLPFCLATNSRRHNALECLAAAGLDKVFSTIISRDEVSQGKPAPDIFLKAAAGLQQDASACLVLEDSPIGIAAACAAGAPCIYVPSVLPAQQQAATQAHAVFADLQQVADFISACFQHPL